MIGRILFAKFQGRTLDCEAKQWRLFADVLDDCARAVQLLAPLCQESLQLPLLCTASVGFSIVGVAGGSTRASLTQHQARAENMAGWCTIIYCTNVIISPLSKDFIDF
jgi:hypothetical protein